MPSKMVTDRQKTSLAVEAAAETLSNDVAHALILRLGPLIDEQEILPDLSFLQVLFGRWLSRERERAVAADTAHTQTLLALQAMLRQRDGAAAQLYQKLVQVRSTLEGAYGSGSAQSLLGLAASLPARDPVVLQRFARDTVSLLTDPELALPAPAFGAEGVTPEELLTMLEPSLAELEGAISKVASAKREVQRTRKGKSEAIDQLDQGIAQTARWLEALYARAGELYHAERVRRSAHRPKPEQPDDLDALPDEPDEPVPATPATPSGEPPPVGGADG